MEDFLALQARSSQIPPADALAWESFVDDSGRRALVVHAIVGRRANDALARALAPRVDPLARGASAETGFALLAPRAVRFGPRTVRALFDAPLAIPDIEETDLYRRRFRHVAERGLLLHRTEGPLSHRQRVAERALISIPPEHPLRREALREATEDALDLPAAEALRASIASGGLPLHRLPERPFASPLAACVLAPRASGIADPRRLATLRDHFERAEEWTLSTVRSRRDSPGSPPAP
jgi:Lhr-like helicase